MAACPGSAPSIATWLLSSHAQMTAKTMATGNICLERGLQESLCPATRPHPRLVSLWVSERCVFIVVKRYALGSKCGLSLACTHSPEFELHVGSMEW